MGSMFPFFNHQKKTVLGTKNFPETLDLKEFWGLLIVQEETLRRVYGNGLWVSIEKRKKDRQFKRKKSTFRRAAPFVEHLQK